MWIPLLLWGCASTPPEPSEPDTVCEYPEGAVEPMAVGEVLWPYSWPTALHLDGRIADIALGDVSCAADPDIDWSPFDILLFVSIPAW